ncbi:hypothetical protein [Streptomyces sp. SID13031]|uniref:hypothetical protein n=1 Tax=Streptomyces sp. SID13031 TaxID=2706046 RepID=UPI0013CCA846|nr:hypothetical protein [Streptomyces sp. SID13031]NEA31291.1 hypothetical protein [Streptomyces sp. SID13031]
MVEQRVHPHSWTVVGGIPMNQPPDWPTLRHANGSAEDLPVILDRMSSASPRDWDVLWSMLCGHGIVYSASFAVLPWLADWIDAEDPDDVLQAVTLAGAIIARADQPHGAADVRTQYATSIRRLLSREHDLLQSPAARQKHDRLLRGRIGPNWENPAVPEWVERNTPRDPPRNALRTVVRDHVAPLLKEAGFARSGHRFTLTRDDGTQAWVTVRSYKLGYYEAEFHVDAGIWPAGLDALEEGTGITMGNTWTHHLTELGDSTETWGLDLDDTASIVVFRDLLCGLRDRLLWATADRRNLIALLRDPANRMYPRERAWLIVVALYDLGPSVDLEAALQECEELSPNHRGLPWIRRQLADRR